MRTLAPAGLLLVTCLPPEPPEWLVAEPAYLGIQTAVVGDGPYAADVTVFPGRERTSPLPLDTLEWRWFGAAPDGVTIRPPLWLRCGTLETCFRRTGDIELPDCPDPLPLTALPTCRLGVGYQIRTRFADAYTEKSALGIYAGILVITSAELDPEVCLSRLRQADPVDIANCLYVLHGAVVPGILLPEGVPEEVRDVPADTNPTLYFSVGRSSASDAPEQPAVDGDVVTVRAGETIHVSVKFGADAEQAYLKVYDGPDEPVVDDAREQLVVTTLMGEWVDGFTASEDGRTLEFIAPDTLDPVVLYARALDDRRGAAFATLQFLAIREGHEEP